MNQDNRAFALAVVISLLLHGALLWGALRWMPTKKATTPARMLLSVEVTPPPRKTTPPPKLAAPPEPIKRRNPEPRPAPPPPRPSVLTKLAPAPAAMPAPAPVPEPAPPPGPPQHKMKTANSSAPSLGAGSGNARKGSVYAPPDYAEKVKAKVNAAIVYPADAKRFLQQCWVEYTLTVDRNGNMLGYKIDNCGDDRLDAAAQAALIKGGPYPPPPDTGASSYEIHGAFVFTLR